jgi:hypothetical protein
MSTAGTSRKLLAARENAALLGKPGIGQRLSGHIQEMSLELVAEILIAPVCWGLWKIGAALLLLLTLAPKQRVIEQWHIGPDERAGFHLWALAVLGIAGALALWWLLRAVWRRLSQPRCCLKNAKMRCQ